MKSYKGIGGVIAGVFLIVAGGLLIAFSRTAIFLPFGGGEDINGTVSLIKGTKESSRIYGVVGMILGAALIWIARWPRWSAQRAAIEDYVWSLSQELSRRFGTKKFYSVEDVSRIAGETSLNMKHIAYAHAMFCGRPDFDTHYAPSCASSTYVALRAVIARRYFNGALGFDAAMIIRLATPAREEEYDACPISDG
jgi:hypothetical protein